MVTNVADPPSHHHKHHKNHHSHQRCCWVSDDFLAGSLSESGLHPFLPLLEASICPCPLLQAGPTSPLAEAPPITGTSHRRRQVAWPMLWAYPYYAPLSLTYEMHPITF